MKQIKLLVGPSGSGKTTFAWKTFLEYPKETIIVNRDNIRCLLFGYNDLNIGSYYSRNDLNDLEKVVTLYEDKLIETGLSQDKTVIIDATHLKVEYIKRHEIWNVPIEIIYFDTPLEECIQNQKKRVREVDEDTVKLQYSKMSNLKKKLQKKTSIDPIEFKQNSALVKCVLFDIDGTLANHENKRNPFDLKLVGQDTSKDFVVQSAKAFYEKGYIVYIVSGREDTCKEDTIRWLKKYNIPYHTLYMRKEKDFRPDWVIKEEIWREIATHSYITQIFDDRDQVVRRARGLGLNVNQVAYGSF